MTGMRRQGYEARHDCLFLAQVVNNKDPDGLGRVKLLVPGLLEPESVWAFPIGRMYGVKEGLHWVPKVNCNGVLWLNQGDVDHPYFLPGPWGSPKEGPDAPLQAGACDPNKVVFRWDAFHALVDGTPGAEKVVFQDETSGTTFQIDRATGNFTRTVTGPTGTETTTIKGNLSETVQTGNETHTVSLGNRTTAVTVGNDTKTVGGNEGNTIGGSRTDAITGAVTETVGAASSETITLSKMITAGLAILLTAGLGITLTAGGAFSAVAAGISLNSSGTTVNASTGLVTNNFLGGIIETIIGTIMRTVSGAVTETVNGLWTMIVNGGLTISGTPIKIGTSGLEVLLKNSYHTNVFLPHTHDVIGVGSPTSIVSPVPPPLTVSAAETHDLTAS